jgi:signal peptide peptidase SppA
MPQPDPLRVEFDALPLGLDLSQYCGVWAIDESAFAAQLAAVRSLDLAAHVAANAGRNVASASVSKAGGVAVIDISGTLTKRGSSMSDAGSLVRLRQAVRAAAADPEVSAILLRIDSPGGTIAGTSDLGDEIASAKAQKPVYAYGEDLVASAAYWLASQADKLYVNAQTAQIGSIGTYFAVHDYSRAAANAGIEAVVIRSHPLKGAGAMPGDPITEEQRAVWQEMVDGIQGHFNAAVMRGRGLTKEQVAAVATGRVFSASEAKKAGLIDGIKSFDETLAELQGAAVKRQKERKRMAAASYQDIVAACDGLNPSKAEDSQFVCDQLAKGVEADAAAKNWMATLAARADAAREAEAAAKEAEQKAKEEAAKAKADADAKAREAEQKAAEAAAKAKQPPGVEPLLDSGKGKGREASDALAEWNEKVAAKVAAGVPRDKALVAVNRENPGLRERMLAEVNQGRSAR